MEPTIFKPRLKFKPPLKFFKFGHGTPKKKHRLKLKYSLIQKSIFCQNSKFCFSTPGTSASNILKIVIILSKDFQREMLKQLVSHFCLNNMIDLCIYERSFWGMQLPFFKAFSMIGFLEIFVFYLKLWNYQKCSKWVRLSFLIFKW